MTIPKPPQHTTPTWHYHQHRPNTFSSQPLMAPSPRWNNCRRSARLAALDEDTIVVKTLTAPIQRLPNGKRLRPPPTPKAPPSTSTTMPSTRSLSDPNSTLHRRTSSSGLRALHVQSATASLSVLHEGNPQNRRARPRYVDVFSSDGQLLQRLEHGDWLNAPGVSLAPLDFGIYSHDLLIGQFSGGGTTEGSGTIAAYDLATGKFIGLVRTRPGSHSRSMASGPSAPPTALPPAATTPRLPASELYFTAGPDHGTGGLFGYLKPVATELMWVTTRNPTSTTHQFAKQNLGFVLGPFSQ